MAELASPFSALLPRLGAQVFGLGLGLELGVRLRLRLRLRLRVSERRCRG